MDYCRLAEQLKALGEPNRLRILEILPPTKNCEHVSNVSELAEELKLPQPTVSHHLKVLYQAGLVKNEKMCRDVYYWVDQPALAEALKLLQKTAKAQPG